MQPSEFKTAANSDGPLVWQYDPDDSEFKITELGIHHTHDPEHKDIDFIKDNFDRIEDKNATVVLEAQLVVANQEGIWSYYKQQERDCGLETAEKLIIAKHGEQGLALILAKRHDS